MNADILIATIYMLGAITVATLVAVVVRWALVAVPEGVAAAVSSLTGVGVFLLMLYPKYPGTATVFGYIFGCVIVSIIAAVIVSTVIRLSAGAAAKGVSGPAPRGTGSTQPTRGRGTRVHLDHCQSG